MGCRISSSNNENIAPSTATDTAEMPNRTATDQQPTSSSGPTVDYKARLERKQCLAKETPEPVYDLADCNLKDVPPGVFIMCKVLRKELLTVAHNRLTALSGGGALLDLQLLVTLNLTGNRFKKLPEEIGALGNLRELLLANNSLERIPAQINRLQKLHLLDVSSNNLTTIEQLSFMANLRILNIGGNPRLVKLPNQLATCDNLVDLVLDPNTITEPPAEVIAAGTYAIVKYLSTGEVLCRPPSEDQQDSTKISTINFINSERDELRAAELAREKHDKEKLMLERERLAYEKDYLAESKLHEQQQRKKQELLEQLLRQQNQNDSHVNRLQEEKQSERQRLINDILKDELHSSELVDKLLSLKNGPDPAFLERERQEQEQLLEQLRIQQNVLLF